MKTSWVPTVCPSVLAILGVVLLVLWVGAATVRFEMRVPGMDDTPEATETTDEPLAVAGEPIPGDGVPADIPGAWPAFRGANRDAICDDGTPLAREWPSEGPPVLWRRELGEGYAGAVIRDGRVYLLDYVVDETVEELRGLKKDECATLADALSGVTPGTFDGMDKVLRDLMRGADEETTEALRELYAEKGENLINALRDDVLDRVDRSTDTMLCLSLADGREIWRNSYPAIVQWNHGMSRTTPTIVGDCVVSIGPRCHVACWDVETGNCRWLIDMVKQFGTEELQWYTGQCPLADGDRVILAPCGADSLLVAVDYKTGNVIWKTPNPRKWRMSHCSIMPMEFAGRKMYLYCGNGGTVGVSAEDGSLLWDETEWVEAYATSPSPLPLPEGRILLSSGYREIGAMMLRLKEANGAVVAKREFTLTDKQFNSEHHTPVFYDGHLYAVCKSSRQLVCLDLMGNELWNSGRRKFGHGPYMIANGQIFALSDRGQLVIAEASPVDYFENAEFQVFERGREAWAPMAIAAGRLIVRDSTNMACLDVRSVGGN